MKKVLHCISTFLLCAIMCSGCANNQQFTPKRLTHASATISSAVDENWNFHATSTIYPDFSFDIGGVLNSKASSAMSGIFELTQTANVTNDLCFTPLPQVTPIAISGSVSTANVLSLASQSQNGQIFTFTGPMVGTAITNGKYTGTGDCGDQGDHGTMTASLMAPITGTYTGTLKDGSTLQINLSQSATADSEGMFHLTGTRTVATGACGSAKTVTIADPNADSYVVGNQFLAVFTDGNKKTVVAGSFNPSASRLSISAGTYGDDCQNVTSGMLQK